MWVLMLAPLCIAMRPSGAESTRCPQSSLTPPAEKSSVVPCVSVSAPRRLGVEIPKTVVAKTELMRPPGKAYHVGDWCQRKLFACRRKFPTARIRCDARRVSPPRCTSPRRKASTWSSCVSAATSDGRFPPSPNRLSLWTSRKCPMSIDTAADFDGITPWPTTSIHFRKMCSRKGWC